MDPERAAAAGGSHGSFPRNCVALDSWANVWLKHQKDMRENHYQDVLHLAHGQCHCHRETSQKGVPTVYVPWTKSNENIDLFQKVFRGNVDAISYVMMISSYGFQKDEMFRYKCGATCVT